MLSTLDVVAAVKRCVQLQAAPLHSGDEAAWHYDNNHNVTVQLYGAKDWYTMPSGGVVQLEPRLNPSLHS